MTDEIKQPYTGPRGPKLSPKEKAAQSPRNIKLAVAAYCYHDCMHEDATNSHSTKFAIKNCTSKDCQLWSFRGWQDISGGTVGPRGKTTG
jgi:hypothetical protein